MEDVLGQLIEREVERSEAIFDAIRARSLAVTGIAGGFVALASGFLALAVGSRDLPELSGWAFVFLAVALLALFVNDDDEWGDPGWDRFVADYLVDYLQSLKIQTKQMARLLAWGIALEVLGISATAAVAVMLGWQLSH